MNKQKHTTPKQSYRHIINENIKMKNDSLGPD